MLDKTNDALIRKVLKRLIPFLMLCFLLNFLDRNNISVAQNNLMSDPKDGGIPGFNPTVFSVGLAIFYIPYCLLEIPSNLIQLRVGARRWISRIMISWGITSACFIFIKGPHSFYWLRGLLGLFEAGFFPGVMLYLSYWIPHEHRARAKAIFFLSTAFAAIFSNVIGGFILYACGKYNLGLAPWQWLFLIEGIPSIIIGVVVLFFLTDKPEDAKWLTADERSRLIAIMAHEKKQVPGHSAAEFKDAVFSPQTWLLALIYSCMNWAYNPVQFYTQATLKSTLAASGTIILPVAAGATQAGTTAVPTPQIYVDLYVSLLSAIPYGIAGVAMLFIARHSDRTNKRKPHIMFCCGLMAVGLVIGGMSPWLPAPWKTIGSLAGLSLSAIGWFGAFATFWAIPAQLMTGAAVAAAMAIVNAIGNLTGNYFGNILRPAFQVKDGDVTRDYALFVAAGMACLGVLVTALLPLKMPSSSSEGEAKPESLAGAESR
jgi:MFS family permease